MNFQTETKVAPYTPVYQPMPKVSLCFNLNSVLSDQVNELFFDQTAPLYTDKLFEEIISQVASAESVIEKCQVRNFSSDHFTHFDNSLDCSKTFNITRYRMQNYICYLLALDEPKKYAFYSVATSMAHPNVLFKLSVNSPLNLGHVVYPLIHFEGYPVDDRTFNQELFPSFTKNEVYHISYDLYEINRLSSPYETKCGQKSRTTCVHNCLEDSFMKLGFSSPSGLLMEEEDSQKIKIADLLVKNEYFDVFDFYKKQKEFCSSRTKCKYESCQQKLVKTHISSPQPSQEEKLILIIETAKNPIYKIKYQPSFLFVDYITQVLSWAGIWIEFSFYSVAGKFAKLLSPKRKNFAANSVKKDLLQASVIIYRITQRLKRKSILKFASIDLDDQRHNSDSTKGRLSQVLVLKDRAIKFIVFLLFLWQLINVVTNYFKYETTVKFNYGLNPILEMPTFAICIKLQYLFGFKSFGITEENFNKMLIARDKWLNMTMEEIFSKTWADEILLMCRFRDESDPLWRFQLLSKEECLLRLNILKFHNSRQMCYSFIVHESNRTYYQTDFQFAEVNPGIIYSLILRPEIKKFSKVKLVAYFGKEAPFQSIEYLAISPKRKGKRFQILSYHLKVVQLLPPPYDTKCNELIGSSRCKQICYKKGLESLERLSYSETEIEPIPVKRICYSDLVNKSTNEHFRTLERTCYQRCQTQRCSYNYTQTYLSNPISRAEYEIEFAIDSAAFPVTYSKSQARYTMYDFYYQIFACLAFWLGFSFLILQPTRKRKCKWHKTMITYRNLCIHLKKLCKLMDISYRNPLKRHFTLKEYSFNRKFLIPSLCSLCCSLQIFHCCFYYFKYPTIIDTQSSPERSTNYAVSFCFDTQELISKANSQKDFTEMTMSDIFDFTPETGNIIDGCRYFGLSSSNESLNEMKNVTDRIFYANFVNKDCNYLFNTRKFIKQSQTCYHVTFKRKNTWNRDQMLNTLNENRKLFLVAFKNSLLTSQFSVIVSNDAPDWIPIHSSVWAPTCVKENRNIWYTVSYVKYVQHVLPAPYDYDGFMHGLIINCLSRCVEANLRSFNSTRTQLVSRPSPLKFFKSEQHSMNQLYKSIEAKCERRCINVNPVTKVETDFDFTVTIIGGGNPVDWGNLNLSAFYLTSSDFPVVTIEYKPQVSLFEFIINIGSIISIWFGFSMVHIANLGPGKSERDFNAADLLEKVVEIEKRVNEYSRCKSQFTVKMPNDFFNPHK